MATKKYKSQSVIHDLWEEMLAAEYEAKRKKSKKPKKTYNEDKDDK